MMRVLYMLHRYHTNMISTMKGWKDHGDELCVLCQYEGKIEEHAYVIPEIVGFSKLSKAFTWFYANVIKRRDPDAVNIQIRYGLPPLSRIKKLIKAFDPDIVILRERSLYTMMIYPFCKRAGYKTILYNLSPVYAEKGYFKNDLAHKIVRTMTPQYRISPTRQIGIGIEGKIREEKAYFAPFIVEPKLPPEKKTYFKNGNINIFEIGKYEERKNHFLMINAIERLKKEYPNIRLTIAGDLSSHFNQEYYDRLTSYVESKNLSDSVDLLSNLSKAEIDKIYSDTDLFVLTSTNEPASITVIEAMCFSVPSISGTDNGTADYIECGITGDVFEDCNEDDLVQKMDKILSDKEKIPNMGRAAYEHVGKNFQFDKYYEAIMKVLDDYK